MRYRRFLICIVTACLALAGSALAKPFAGIDYSPRNINFSRQATVPEAQIAADLAILAPLTDRIRTYSAGGGMERVPDVAKKFHMRVAMGLWLGPDKAANATEIASGLAAVRRNPGVVDKIIVGNETQLRHDLTEDELRAYLRDVRKAVGGLGIEVTTAETWSEWLKHPNLGQDCDVIGAHIIPYWDGVAYKDGAAIVAERYAALQAQFPGKKIVILETGWPSRGQTRQGAEPSVKAQSTFFNMFLPLAAARGYDYYALESFDQPWKAADEGEIGGAWGLLDAHGIAKFKIESAGKR
jgi:exo-beta-1,3-glucanase (GH17 family)